MAVNPRPSRTRFRWEVVFLVLVAAVCGACAGAAAGFAVSSTHLVAPPVQIVHTITTTTTAPVVQAPTTTFALVPVARTPAALVLPPAFLSRRASPVASLYRTPKGTDIDDRLLDDSHLLGQAVALTSDGWFVTTASAIQNIPLAGLTLWIDGQAFTVDQGVLDMLNGTAYLKTSATGLTPVAFAQVGELTGSEAVWTEPRPDELEPAAVLNVQYRPFASDAYSSESATRRIIVSGTSAAGDVGSAAWDPDGSLIGLVESGAGEQVRLIPVTSIDASFSSLLSTGQISHASLGVHAIDLADMRFAGSRGTLPFSGAWIHDDKKSGKPGVSLNGAAAKAKLKDGDVILSIEHDILDGTADLGEVLSNYRPGASVTVRVHRDAGDVDVPVQLGTVVTSQALK